MAQASSVLVLDDDPACLGAASEVEVGAGVVVHACRTIPAAERLLAHVQVDVALVDHDLGTQASGLQWLGWLKRRDPDCFRIITTEQADLDFAISAINQGQIDGMLVKPWRQAQLVQLVHQGCETALIRRHNRSLVNELGERNSQLLDLTANLEAVVAERTQHLREAMDQLRTAHEEMIAQQRRLVDLETDGAIAQVVRGLAHELNNPLGVILGYAQRLRRTWARDNADAAQRIDVILDEVDRCVSLVEQLRGLSVPLVEEIGPTRPEDCLAQAEAGLRTQGRPVPTCRISGPIPMVQAAPRALQRVMAQIIDNAVGHRARRIDLAGSRHGQQVQLTLANDGDVPDEIQVRNALRPFYTTRADAGHRGLGLAMAASLLREQRGAIELSRRLDAAGAVVTISLPAAEGPAPERSGRGCRVLIVDDDPLVGGLLVEAAREAGCAPEQVQTAAAAQAAAAQADVVLLDRHLGDGDGLALADELVRRRPGLAGRIALVTGDPGDPGLAGCRLRILAKPFRMEDAVQLVLEMI